MLHIKSHPPNPIEKPFSKTHTPVFGIGMLKKFYSSRIHTFPKQHPPKTPLQESLVKSIISID